MTFRSRRSCLNNEVTLVEINQLLAGMVTAIESSAILRVRKLLPRWRSISQRQRSRRRRTALSRSWAGASRRRQPRSEVVGASTPRRTLDFVFLNSVIPVGPYINAPLGVGQHIEPSKHGKGLTIAFSIDGFDCGVTASARDGVIETLFCGAKSRPAGRPEGTSTTSGWRGSSATPSRFRFRLSCRR